MKSITKKDIEQLNSNFEKKPVQKALSRVLVKNELSTIF